MLRARPALRILLGALFLALAMPASAQSALTGSLDLVWVDPIDGSRPRLLAFLTVDGTAIPLEFGDALQPALLGLNRRRVTVTGNPVAQLTTSGPGGFQVQRIQGTDIAPGTTPAGSGNLASGPLLSGPQPWVTILCRFADSTNITPADPSFHVGQLISGPQNATNYWREISYNNIQLTGSTVVGWYNLSSPRSAYGSGSSTNIGKLAEDCSAVADADVNFADYVGINFVFNQGTGDSYRGGGWTLTRDGVTRSWRTTWLYNTYNLTYLLHEMGHGFGFPHSSGPYGETYDSKWDVMSLADPPVHTISFHKDMNGWIPANRIVTVYSGSSVAVTLDALGVPVTSTVPLMVKIPIGDSFVHFYTVELRRRVGFDANLSQTAFTASGNAVLIHDVLTTRNIPGSSLALLVDGDNNGNPNDAGANWTVGEAFYDSTNGVRVEVTSETASSVTIVVTNRAQQQPRLYFGTLAGTSGTRGSTDGTGGAARFDHPTGVAVDGAGNVYVSDQFNSTIRKISPAGVVTTFAGLAGSSAIVDGSGANARFGSPTGLAIDAAGMLYVADGFYIRKISPLGAVSTLPQLPTQPSALAVDAAGTIYAASYSSVIYKVTSGGVVTTLAGLANTTGTADGTGSAARFNFPTGIAVDSAGVVYVSDTSNFTIRRISPSGTVTTLAGVPGIYYPMEDGTGAGNFDFPAGLAMLSDGSFYVADAFHNAIRRVTPAGIVTTVAGKWTGNTEPGADGEDEAARFNQPKGIAVDAAGTIYTADYGTHVIRIGTRRPLIKVSTAALRFGATRANGQLVSLTAPQEVTVGYQGAVPAWTAVADQPWVKITAGSGTGAGRFTVNVADPGANVSSATATITVAAPGVAATTMTVVLTIQVPTASAAPFGAFDTPANNATSLAGAIAVTGWTLDNVGVVRVQLWRNCVEAIDRPAGACTSSAPGQPANFVYIGDAAFLAGARPDVEVANLGVPLSYRAGWGYLMSTNALPHLPTAQGAGGQGSFTLSAYAIDVEGQFTLLGTKSISIDNDNATIPFGVLDTPTQGGTITVSPYASFGWAMTQSPKCIDPTKTMSYKVYIDGVSRPIVPNVNWFAGLTRPDIAAAYPGRCNTNNALAAYYIDANALGLANGLHTTGWDVMDDKGNVAGIGSRFFNVLIGSSVTPSDVVSGFSRTTTGDDAGVRLKADTTYGIPNGLEPDSPLALGNVGALTLLGAATRAVRIQLGSDNAPTQPLTRDSRGQYQVQFGIGGRLLLDLGGEVEAGYQVVGEELRALPAGSTLDATNGAFAWQPPTPFLGPFHLVFIGSGERIDVHATIVDPTLTAPIEMHIDTPAADSTVSGSFVIAGWALDPRATTGSGIDTLHVWAYRRDGIALPQFLGAAAVGGARPDVAAIFGAQAEASGFTLTTSALLPGVYDFLVYPSSHRAGQFEAAQSVHVTVR